MPWRTSLPTIGTALVCGDAARQLCPVGPAAPTRLAHFTGESQGVGAGDHVGLYLYNCNEYLDGHAGLLGRSGRCTINVNYRYVAGELRYIFDNAELKGLIYEPELFEHVEGAGHENINVLMERGPKFHEALAAASAERNFEERSPDDLVIIYTGGTTGMPRGVMWRQEDLFFAALQGGNPGGEPFDSPKELVAQVTKNGDGLHVHTAPPLIHGSSQLASWIAMLNGGVASLVPGRHFDPVATFDACNNNQIHSLNIVGDAMALPLIQALEDNPGRWELADLNVIASAGAVLSANLIQKLEGLIQSAMVLNSFGASETGHQGSAFYEDGKPQWFMDEEHTVVLDENLERVEPGSGKTGILSRFGHIPLGYYKDPEKTAQVFKEKDGVRYVMNGDMAMVAEDESIIFLGRGSVCINTGGEKVYAEEVEEVLKHHPQVFDAMVVGVPDERWTNRVEALITQRGEGEVDSQAIKDFCRDKLANYKVPKTVWVVTDLNRQPSGKPDYRWAREKAVELGADA